MRLTLFKDFTFAIPSYNTPGVLTYCLKSLIFHHQNQIPKILISENSTNDDTVKILDENRVPYFRDPGSTHSPSVQRMMEKCKTRYFIHCDSDILFLKPVNILMEKFIENDLCIMGEEQGDRGGYKFVCPRIAPYFIVVDMEKVSKFNLVWHDDERITASNSKKFFDNIPVQFDRNGIFYDCGTPLYEDVVKNNLKIGRVNKIIPNYICHMESLSWGEQSGIPGYIELGKKRKEEFMKVAKRYENVNIKSKFAPWDI